MILYRKKGRSYRDDQKSGIRGRERRGLPHRKVKWRAFTAAQDIQPAVVCNADEGDPGAFTDRSILEGDPLECFGSHDHSWLPYRGKSGLHLRAYGISHCLGKAPEICHEQARAKGEAVVEGSFGYGFDFDLGLSFGPEHLSVERKLRFSTLIMGRREPRPRPLYACRGRTVGKTDLN